MNFILRDCCPPLVQVSKLGSSCSQVFAVLWESDYKQFAFHVADLILKELHAQLQQ